MDRLNTLLEGAPAYGVLDAKDGVLLFRRSGFEQEFNELAAEAVEAAGDEFEVIPLTNGDDCDRLFIALVAAFWKGRVTFWTVAAAGIASAVTYRLAGPPLHVAAGALCGLLAAWLAAGAEERPVTKEAKA